MITLVKKIEKEIWGNIAKKKVFLFHLINKNGYKICVSNYGAIIQSIWVPGKKGQLHDVVLGYDTLEDYIKDPFYMGCVVGRYAGRIDEGKFKINDDLFLLNTNTGGYHLHGGQQGFNKKLWDAECFENDITSGVNLRYKSPHLEEGFPGNLLINVTYTLDDNNCLTVNYSAETDEPTVINLTQHSYFNLAADDVPITDHYLQINASEFLQVNKKIIPIGSFIEVKNTVFDFTTNKKIGQSINEFDEQLNLSNGYDHTYVLKTKNSLQLIEAAVAMELSSGIQMKVYTTEPGIHFYSGNFLSGDHGKRYKTIDYRKGFCLETQHFGNSPNLPEFPSTLLKPAEAFNSKTIFEFSIKK